MFLVTILGYFKDICFTCGLIINIFLSLDNGSRIKLKVQGDGIGHLCRDNQ